MRGKGAPRYWQASSQLIQSTLAKPQMPKKPPACSTLSAANPAAAQGLPQAHGTTYISLVCTCTNLLNCLWNVQKTGSKSYVGHDIRSHRRQEK